MRKKVPNSSGFTLMELMVVIAIIAILTAISVPLMSEWKARHEFVGALQDVMLTFRQARTVAVEENEIVMVSVNDATGQWQAFVDDGGGNVTDDYGVGADGVLDDNQPDGVPDRAQNRTWDAGERIIASGSLPDSVGISSTGFTLSFNTGGFPVNATGTLVPATVTLTSSLGGSRSVNLFRSGYSVIQ